MARKTGRHGTLVIGKGREGKGTEEWGRGQEEEIRRCIEGVRGTEEENR